MGSVNGSGATLKMGMSVAPNLAPSCPRMSIDVIPRMSIDVITWHWMTCFSQPFFYKGFKMVLDVLESIIGGAAGIEFNSFGVDFIDEILC